MPPLVHLLKAALCLFVLLVVAAPRPATAQSDPLFGQTCRHGIAMHGDLKYPPDFDHLDYVNVDAPRGGTLRLGATGSFDSLNPFILKGEKAAGLNQVFETLMARTWDEAFSLYGLVAECAAMPDDRSWIAFRLNPAARFADGSPITADDILFSWQTLREFGRPNAKATYARVASLEVVDPLTVRFVMGPQADGELPLVIAGFLPVLSKAWYTTHAFDETSLTPPLGSGPYTISAVEAGRRMVYARNPDWWGRDLPVNRGHYNFDTIVYDYFRDGQVMFEAFKAGELDFRGEGDATRWATAYDFPAVADGQVVMESLAHGAPAGLLGFVMNTRRPPLDDIALRRALVLAFDFEWTNQALFHGAFARTNGMFTNSELAYSGLPSGDELALLEPFRDRLPPALFTTPFVLPATDGSGDNRANLRTASALLEDAGYTITDGALVSPAGKPVAFEILLVNPNDEGLALNWIDSLRRLGITAIARTVDSAQYQLRRTDYDYDITLHRWGVSLSPGNEQMLYWHSSGVTTPGTRNYAGVDDPVVDALAQRLSEAVTRAELVAAARAL
ncbi:MAG: extracellular solute-binding protein, partial [Alphaproteobacteria bacterium]